LIGSGTGDIVVGHLADNDKTLVFQLDDRRQEASSGRPRSTSRPEPSVSDPWRTFAARLDPSNAKDAAAISGHIELVRLDVTDHAAIEALSTRLKDEPLPW
jgi:hypothetical protein